MPLYLHPREPLPSQALIYAGYPSLIGSAWGFAHETGTHAVRLMLGGIFDQYPGIQVILGHLGEGLPFLLPRLEHRLEHRLDKQRGGVGLGSARRKVSEYFNDDFYVTASGHFHTRTLFATISEIGVDRVMFSADYPYETMEEATSWFDSTPLLPGRDVLTFVDIDSMQRRVYGHAEQGAKFGHTKIQGNALLAQGQDRKLLPLSLGYEVAGVVSALGPGTWLASGGGAAGDEVVASTMNGGYATAVTVPAPSVFAKPPSLTFPRGRQPLAGRDHRG